MTPKTGNSRKVGRVSSRRSLLTPNIDHTCLPTLHEAIIGGLGRSEFEKLILTSPRDQKNSLGQTPLHVAAIFAPHMMEILVQCGHRLEVTDRFRATPFAWACSEVGGFDGEVLVSAIEAAVGTNTYDRQSIYEMWALLTKRSANKRQLPTLLMGVQSLLRAGYHAFAKNECLHALTEFMRRDVDIGSGSSEYEPQISELLGMILPGKMACGGKTSIEEDPHLQFESTFWLAILEKKLRKERRSVANRLIGRLSLASHVNALVERDFDLAEYVGPSQKNALSTLILYSDVDLKADLIQALLDCGVDPNHQDHRGYTPLHFLSIYVRWNDFGQLSPTQNLTKLLAGGACPTIRDKCRCSCAPDGCLALWMEITPSTRALPLKAILQVSILELHSPVMSREVLLALVRRAKHELLGIPHVCCMRESAPYGEFPAPLPPDDIDEILQDEVDHIRDLDLDIDSHKEEIFEDIVKHWYRCILISQRRRQAQIEKRVSPNT